MNGEPYLVFIMPKRTKHFGLVLSVGVQQCTNKSKSLNLQENKSKKTITGKLCFRLIMIFTC